jgi:hypothetical protein
MTYPSSTLSQTFVFLIFDGSFTSDSFLSWQGLQSYKFEFVLGFSEVFVDPGISLSESDRISNRESLITIDGRVPEHSEDYINRNYFSRIEEENPLSDKDTGNYQVRSSVGRRWF